MSSDNSRRDFVRDSVVALAALPALGAVAALADTTKVAAAGKLAPVAGATFKLSRNNLAFLSNSLYNSPAERQKFLADPKGYSEHLFKAGLDPAESQKLRNVADMFASGVCCNGCGCSGAPGAEISQPALKR